jgi:glutathione synthase/RimK-type ligase-like ATP-grasp enzyme
MRIGIFGAADDAQCQAFSQAAARLGADTVLVAHDALDHGVPLSFVDGSIHYQRTSLDDVRGFYVRYIPAPYAPALQRDDQLVLYEDWHTAYMQSRERATLCVSWLLALQHRGVAVVNPPHAASVIQFKPFQLHVLKSMGARVPRTLISNDPERIRQFKREVGNVIFKPVTGGALTQSLDQEAMSQLELVTASPVIFQERVPGEDVRVTLVGDRVVSCVSIGTSGALDYRDDPLYTSGQAMYREVVLPQPVLDFCRRAARECGLLFTGIDLKHSGEDWVFLELNSSPIYMEVELSTGHPITEALASFIIERARASRP